MRKKFRTNLGIEGLCAPADCALFLNHSNSVRKNSSVRQVSHFLNANVPLAARTPPPHLQRVSCPHERPVAVSAPLRQWGIKASAGAGERVILWNTQRVSGVCLESDSGEDALDRLLLDAKRRWRWSDFGFWEKTIFFIPPLTDHFLVLLFYFLKYIYKYIFFV